MSPLDKTTVYDRLKRQQLTRGVYTYSEYRTEKAYDTFHANAMKMF